MANGEDYEVLCRNQCGNNIVMSSRSGRWLPYNKDGSQHFCQGGKTNPDAGKLVWKPRGGGGISQEQFNELKLELKALDKKIMAIGEAVSKIQAMIEQS